MWFWRCQLAREEGARVVADQGAVARPCDPDDIYRIALTAYRQGRMGLANIRVLARFGRGLCPPDSRDSRYEVAAVLWEQGLEALRVPLENKGIVAEPVEGRVV